MFICNDNSCKIIVYVCPGVYDYRHGHAITRIHKSLDQGQLSSKNKMPYSLFYLTLNIVIL